MNKKFYIEGMTCGSCVALNQKSLNATDGITDVSINFATKQAKVEYDETIIGFQEIKAVVEGNGFSVQEETIKIGDTKQGNIIFKRFLFSLLLSLPVFSMMFGDFSIGSSFFGVDVIMYSYAFLSFWVVMIFGWHFHKNAYNSLKTLHFNMDSLVSLGTLTAFFYSFFAMFVGGLMVYFEAAVAIITLINLGRYLEYKAKKKTGDALGKLLQLGVKQATVKQGNTIIQKNIDDIKIGEICIVKAGEKIPLDGAIVEGGSNIDESMLTGESIPVFKSKGDSCYGATISLDGNINIKVEKENNHGTLANIIKLVDQAQTSKAPIQHLADKVSGFFVPAIIGISFLTFLIWFLYTGSISQAIIVAVASLVIACPCALGLATPTAIMVGTGVGAQNGILIKNAETLEKTKDIDLVVFDKTGTLTNGKPELTDIVELKKDKKSFIGIAKSLCSLSHHPLSNAIAQYKTDEKIQQVEDFKEIKGKGLQGLINGKRVKLGNQKLFGDIPGDITKKLEKFGGQGKTPILVGDDSEIFGILCLIDLPKPGGEKTIDRLHQMGVDLVMLTGDNKQTAQYIGNMIGIDTVIAEVLPDEKLEVIKNLQSKNKKVAFVGDGINDAPALVQSDLSIAMGTGSDIAIESADIVLVQGNLEKVVGAMQLSKRTLSTIKQNLFWAFIYNSIGIPLACFGMLNPIFASFAMSMSSVSVIANSIRLKRFRIR